MVMNTRKSKALEKISKRKENGRQNKWVGFYHKYHIQKMSICIVLIYRFLNLSDLHILVDLKQHKTYNYF
jgi:hypothetical protein